MLLFVAVFGVIMAGCQKQEQPAAPAAAPAEQPAAAPAAAPAAEPAK
jgi:hypothetical protein